MGETSAIEWTDATVNFWWGCTKVGPGCDHCYAESFDKRTGGAHWGTGAPRRQIASAAITLAKLNRQGGKRVFIQSMSDLFDNEVPGAWFDKAWGHIHNATNSRIQIVTKRISRVERAVAESGPPVWPQHAGLMITVVNQAEADRDIPRLLALKAKLGIPWVGLSMEPLLGPVNLAVLTDSRGHDIDALRGIACDPTDPDGADDYYRTEKLDWVIVGGESGPKARPMHPDWARSLRDQCQAAGVPFFFKQWGEWAPGASRQKRDSWVPGHLYEATTAFGQNAWIAAQEAPWSYLLERTGKARAGRLLDGREWNDMPGALTHD